jgi:DinB superfamily
MQSTTSTAAATAVQPSLTAAEIELAILYLEQTRNGVVGAVTGLSEAQWKFKAAPGVWSVVEIAEHIAFVQERVLGMLNTQLPGAPPAPANRDIEHIDALIINRFPNRLAKFAAPEPLHPKGDCGLPEVLDRVRANTQGFARCLESTPDLRLHALESAPLKAISKGEHTLMDGYQWILAASAHTERHTKQILEVKADPKFPAS